MVSIISLLLVMLSFQKVSMWNPSREIEGHTDGFLTDCPSTLKPAYISKESLKQLGLIVVGTNTTQLKNGRTYNYYQTKQMVKDPNLDFRKKTVFFVGGYLDNPNFFLYSKLMGNILKKLNYNVLLLQAQHFMIRQFVISVRMVRPVAFHITEMLLNLKAAGLNPKDLQIIGISLGGEVMSFIAKNFYTLTGTKIGHLTGLDPTGPCFRNLGPDQRLDSSDADFVEVLHTNTEGLGMAAPVGHVDFYINGGEYQPSAIRFLPCIQLCSHGQAIFLWISILDHPNSFIAVKCDSVRQARRHECYDRVPMETNLVGRHLNKSNTGIFYLATSNEFPYYLGEEGLKKENMIWTKLSKKYESDVLVL